jgi:hypothetical protein
MKLAVHGDKPAELLPCCFSNSFNTTLDWFKAPETRNALFPAT